VQQPAFMPAGQTPQAAPVPPVTCPPYLPPGVATQGPQAVGQPMPGQQTPWQQQMSGQLVNVARLLEQSIPGYQLLAAVFADLMAGPRAQAVAGGPQILTLLRDLTFAHYLALGTIRRYLCGETTADVLAALGRHTQELGRLHTQLRPLYERAIMNAQPDLRPVLSGLGQSLTATESLLQESTNAIQAVVGSYFRPEAAVPPR
jgi:hypothetical protein